MEEYPNIWNKLHEVCRHQIKIHKRNQDTIRAAATRNVGG